MSIADIWDAMPADWKVSVEVLRGGGRDRFGNPLPETQTTVENCLIAGRATEDPLDFSDLTDDKATLYQQDADAPEGGWLGSDRVVIPDGPWVNGRFAVDGSPKQWAMGGWEVPLRRDPDDNG